MRSARATAAYQALVEQIRADGWPAANYQFPLIADERRAGSTVLQRLALVEVSTDREVWMLYSSFMRALGPGLIWAHGPEAAAIAVGTTGGGPDIPGAQQMPALSWYELPRDLRLARHFTGQILIHSLEGCVWQGFLPRLRSFDWAHPGGPMIPDSTRVFTAYLLGLKNYKTATYLDVIAASNSPFVHPPLNNVQILASSADDLVSYYSRALRGKFFRHGQTLSQFRELLSIADAIWLIPVPLGVSAFMKGGSIDVPGFHAICLPGGLFFDNRWVFFCFTLNWPAPAETDPKTDEAFAAAAHQALQIVISALS